jgi:hypothetical protein
MRYTDKQMNDGRARLKRLLPDAEAYARNNLRNPDIQMQFTSDRGIATHNHIRVDNFRSLVVYRTSRGWYADLLLKKVPAGVSDVLGTPMTMPHETKEEAENAAEGILQAMCLQSFMNKGAISDVPKRDERPFTLFKLVIPLPGEVVDLCVPAIAMSGQTVPDAQAYAMGRLSETCGRFEIDETTTKEDMDRLPDAARAEIFRLCCMMAAANICEFPPSEWAAEAVLDDPKGNQPENLAREDDTASTSPS